MKVNSAITAAANGCAQVNAKSYGLPEIGLLRCQEKSGAAIAGIRKLENRAKPAAMDAAELDSPTVECIQPNRTPQTGPSPSRKQAHCPPASGGAAPSPASARSPTINNS